MKYKSYIRTLDTKVITDDLENTINNFYYELANEMNNTTDISQVKMPIQERDLLYSSVLFYTLCMLILNSMKRDYRTKIIHFKILKEIKLLSKVSDDSLLINTFIHLKSILQSPISEDCDMEEPDDLYNYLADYLSAEEGRLYGEILYFGPDGFVKSKTEELLSRKEQILDGIEF